MWWITNYPHSNKQNKQNNTAMLCIYITYSIRCLPWIGIYETQNRRILRHIVRTKPMHYWQKMTQLVLSMTALLTLGCDAFFNIFFKQFLSIFKEINQYNKEINQSNHACTYLNTFLMVITDGYQIQIYLFFVSIF